MTQNTRIIINPKCKYCNLKLYVTPKGYYCNECKLYFEKEKLIENRRELLRQPNINRDPYFFQYTDTQDLLDCINVELVNYLGMARKLQRELRKRVFYSKEATDKLDKDNLKGVNRVLIKIESILIERNGYIPGVVLESSINNELEKLEKQQRRYIKKNKLK